MTDRDQVMSLLERSPGKRPEFFPQAGVDQLFSMVVELAAEVWVLRERLYAVEDVTTQDGQPIRTKVDQWAPTDRQTAELTAMREMLMRQLFRTVSAKSGPGRPGSPLEDPSPPGL